MITVKGLTVVNGMDVTKLTHPSWIWFTLTSTVISLLVMLFSGSLQIKRNVWGETIAYVNKPEAYLFQSTLPVWGETYAEVSTDYR